MPSIPKTMRSLAVPRYCEPAEYEVMELPVPDIRSPHEVLVQVHAASLNTGDTQAVGGDMRFVAHLR